MQRSSVSDSFKPKARDISNASSTCCTEGAYCNAFRIATQRLSDVRRHSILPLAEMLVSSDPSLNHSRVLVVGEVFLINFWGFVGFFLFACLFK